MKARFLATCSLLGFWTLGVVGQEPPTQDSGESRRAAQALLRQDVYPALEGRSQRAEIRARAASAYFAGEGPWEEAFPRLAGASLADRAYLEGQLLRLAEEAAARDASRVAEGPFLDAASLAPEDLARWRQRLQEVCDAEDRAEGLEGRFLRGLIAGLEEFPQLREEAWPSFEAPWAALRSGWDESLSEAEARSRALQEASDLGEAQNLIRLFQRAVWRHLTIPGDGTLDELALAESERLVQGLSAPDDFEEPGLRRDLLERVHPLLGANSSGSVGGALESARRWVVDRRLPELRAALVTLEEEGFEISGTPSEVEAELGNFEVSAETWRVFLDSPPATLDPDLSSLEKERARLELQLAEGRAAALRRQLERGKRLAAVGIDPLAGSADTRTRSEDAQNKAEEARLEAARESQPLQQRVADLRTETASILTGETERHEANLQEIEEFQRSFDARRGERELAQALLPLAAGRAERLDAVYLANHSAIEEQRNWLQDHGEDLAAAEEDRAQRMAELAAESNPEAASTDREMQAEWSAARAELVEALALRHRNYLAEREAVFRVLGASKQERHRLRHVASDLARGQTRRTFVAELVTEVHEIPEILSIRFRRWVNGVRNLPALVLGDFNVLESMVTSTLLLLFVVWVWFVLRRASGDWLQQRWAAVVHGRSAGVRGPSEAWSWRLDSGKWVRRAEPVLRRLVDLVALVGLYLAFLRPVPGIGVAVLLWILWTVYRLMPRLVELAIVTPGEWRPGLARTSEDTRRRAAATTRWLCGGLFTWGVLRAAIGDLLAGDRLLEVADWVALLALGLLVGVFLLRWYPALRRRAVLELPNGRWEDWFARETSSFAGRLLRSVVATVFLTGLGIVRGVARYGDFRWLRLAVARNELKEAGSVKTPITSEERARIVEQALAPPPEAEELDKVRRAFGAWRAEGRRGLVAIIGDRGSGKSSFVARFLEDLDLEKEGLDAKVLEVEGRPLGAEEARLWLAKSLGLSWGDVDAEDAPSREEILTALAVRQGGIFVLDDLHGLMLRTVGGFSGLREILAICQESSEHHFWMVTVHGATWSYLKGIASRFHLGIFREQIFLRPIGPEVLSHWLRESARAAGFEVGFELLVPRENLRGSADHRERVREAFWRLLCENSRGNPEVALAIWLASLCRSSSKEPHRLDVFVPEVPQSETVEEWPTDEHFVLAALLLHDGLTLDSLSESLNLSRGTLVVTCRHLRELGVVERRGRGDELVVTPLWIPAVVRVLEQRHFLFRS